MRRTVLRGLSLHAGGSAAVAAVGLLRSVLIARIMGPAAFGLWQWCLVALRLAGECQLGALHAMAVEGPIHRASGRPGEARALEGRAVTLGFLLSLVPAAAAGILLRVQGGAALGWAAVLLAGACVAWQALQSAAAVLRARGRFGTLTILQVSFAAVHLAGLLLLLPGRYITGALAAWAAGAAAAVAVAAFAARDPLPRPSPAAVRGSLALVRRGGAAWLVGLTFLLLFQVDRILVGAILGREVLGQFGILLIAGTALLFLPDVLAGVLWPMAGERFGESGERAASLRGMAERSLRGLARPLACLVVLGFQGTDVLVKTLLPGYGDSLPALRAYLPGVFLLCLTIPLRTLLVTVRGERPVLAAQVAVLVLAAAAEGAAALSGGGLAGVCAAGAGAALVLLCLLLRQAAGVLGFDGGRWLPFAAEAVLLAAGAFAADLLLSLPGIPQATTAAGVLLRIGLPLALGAAALAPLLRREPPAPGVPSPPGPAPGE